MTEKEVHFLDGRHWVWTGSSWYDEKTYEKPSALVLQKLAASRKGKTDGEDDKITDFQEQLEAAKIAKLAGDLQRAERFLRRALDQKPGHWGALSILCSVLRAANRPDEAVKVTDAVAARCGNAPLLTSRAAALCDLERWEEALRLVSRIQATGPGLEAVVQVRRRIRAARPDLFDDRGDS